MVDLAVGITGPSQEIVVRGRRLKGGEATGQLERPWNFLACSEIKPGQIVEWLRLVGIKLERAIQLPDGRRSIVELQQERAEIDAVVRVLRAQPHQQLTSAPGFRELAALNIETSQHLVTRWLLRRDAHRLAQVCLGQRPAPLFLIKGGQFRVKRGRHGSHLLFVIARGILGVEGLFLLSFQPLKGL